MEFELSVASGYIRLYRDGVLLCRLTGDTHGGGSSYWKQGIYTEMQSSVCMPKDTTLYIKDLQLVSGTVLAPLPVLSSKYTHHMVL